METHVWFEKIFISSANTGDSDNLCRRPENYHQVRLITWNGQHDYREFTQYLMKKLSSFIILHPRIWLTKRDKQLKKRHAIQNITTLSDDVQDHTSKYREKCYELQTRKTSEWEKTKHVLLINFTFLLKMSRRGRPPERLAKIDTGVCVWEEEIQVVQS